MSNGIPSYAELEGLSDREILIMVVGELREIRGNQTSFIRRGWALAMVGIATGLAGVTNFAIAMFVLFSRG